MVRVLVTRPEPAASRTARSLAARGHTPLLAPMLRMRRLSPADRDVPADGAALAVTSARAIEAVADTPMWETLRDLPVFAVGEATARAARTAGAARVVPAGGDLDALAAQVVRAHPRRVIYLAGRQRSGDLCAVLRAAGIACDLHEVYDMETARRHPRRFGRSWRRRKRRLPRRSIRVAPPRRSRRRCRVSTRKENSFSLRCRSRSRTPCARSDPVMSHPNRANRH